MAWLIYDSDGNLISTNNKIIQPEGFVISDDSIKIHGIDNERANADGESLASVMALILDDIKTVRAIVGHNIEYDLNVLEAEMYRLYGEFKIPDLPRICTMKSSTDYCAIPASHGYKWPTLSELHLKLFHKDFDKAHDALVDIEATANCFWKLKEIGVIDNTDLEESIELPF